MPVFIYNVLPTEYDTFKAGFLKRYPVPKTPEGTALMDEDDWIGEWGRIMFQNAYESGTRQIASENAELIGSIFRPGQGPPS